MGHVSHLLASTVDKSSRDRRELAGRFVPLDNATSLLKSKPTHSSIFGSSSTEAALEVVTKAAKQNKESVYRAKTTKKPFQRSGVFGKGFPRSPQSQQTQYCPQYRQYYQNPRGAYSRYNQGRGQYQPWYGQRGGATPRSLGGRPEVTGQRQEASSRSGPYPEVLVQRNQHVFHTL